MPHIQECSNPGCPVPALLFGGGFDVYINSTLNFPWLPFNRAKQIRSQSLNVFRCNGKHPDCKSPSGTLRCEELMRVSRSQGKGMDKRVFVVYNQQNFHDFEKILCFFLTKHTVPRRNVNTLLGSYGTF